MKTDKYLSRSLIEWNNYEADWEKSVQTSEYYSLKFDKKERKTKIKHYAPSPSNPKS